MDTGLQEIKDIIVRTLLGENTEEERQLLDVWRRENEVNELFYRKVCDAERIAAHLREYSDLDVSKAFQENQRRLRQSIVRRMIRRSLPYAALLVLALGAVLFWPEKKHDVEIVQAVQAVNPGSRQAELILADGKTVHLKEGMDTKLREGVAEVIIRGNSINYSEGEGKQQILYNTIRTPLGGEYSVTLADGTEVWLNAMSELKYPVHFKDNERRVELKGEAYFKVKRDASRPFYVTVADYEIKVLGTSFNMKAYENDNCWQATLCTGKINFTDLKNRQNVILSPGNQAVCDRNTGQMVVEKVDVDLFTAWTKGEFRFDNTPIEEIFTILQRWYKIDIFYASQQVRNEVFSGKLPRFDQLQVILDIMEKVSDVRFEMRGNTLIVK